METKSLIQLLLLLNVFCAFEIACVMVKLENFESFQDIHMI